jgi:3-methyladenine DNA glycosylase/8-oxoguanine DNA glycosylase
LSLKPDSSKARAVPGPRARISLAAATAALRRRDPAFDRLVAFAGPIRHRPRNHDGHFGTLVHAVVFQQLSGAVARAIFERVVAAAGGNLSARTLASLGDDELRGAGLSRNKLLSLRDLCAKVLDGSVDLSANSRRSDDEIVAELVTVRGIGRWTAEMYLMFELRRLDVWPVDDLGVRQGYAFAWGLDPAPKPKELQLLGERFRPYRSIVARYCWQAVALFRSDLQAARRALQPVKLKP